jgi:hypothetical protein
MRRGVVVLSRLGAVCLLLASLAGCGGNAAADSDEYTDNLNALNRAAQQGQAGRSALRHTGTKPTDQQCGALFDATAASKVTPDSKEFIAQARAAFVNGCMGRASVPTTATPAN